MLVAFLLSSLLPTGTVECPGHGKGAGTGLDSPGRLTSCHLQAPRGTQSLKGAGRCLQILLLKRRWGHCVSKASLAQDLCISVDLSCF